MSFQVSIITEPFDAEEESALAPLLDGLFFCQCLAPYGFLSTRADADEQTIQEDAVTMLGELQRRGIQVEGYRLDLI
jgi:hypothetical protein